MGREFTDRVRKAMQSSPAGEHPSADVLNAYAEHALSQAESEQVLHHLSTCADCREVIFLAAAAVEVPEEVPMAVTALAAAAPQAKPAARIRWWTWAVPAAAVLVAASVLLLAPGGLMPRRQSRELAQAVHTEKEEAQKQQPTAPPPPAVATSQPGNATIAIAPVVPEKRRDLAKAKDASGLSRLSAGAAAQKPEPALAEKKFVTGGPLPKSSGELAFRNAPAPAAAPAEADALDKSVTQTVQAQGAASALQTETTELAQSRNEVAGGAGAAKTARTMAMASSTRAKLIPAWRVSRGGSLEHLVGDTWHTATGAPGGPFLSVTNFGRDVWAAANNLALYHSGDDGAHWERQTLPAELSGEIVQVSFVSALDGTIALSSGEKWATHDGGKTWAKE